MTGVRYSHTIHEHALAVVFRLSLPERRKIMDECDKLAHNPFVEPDYVRADAAGREMSHVIRGSHAIAYWVDHGERLVCISRIDPADLFG